MHVEGLVFAAVGIPDNAAVARTLADALGAELEESGEVNRLLFPNGSSVALVPPGWVAPPSDTLLGFLVDDVEAAAVELAEKGVQPEGELQVGYGFRYRHFLVAGRRFELLDRKA